MMDSDRRGAPMARREEWRWVAPNDRRATQPGGKAGMERRSESVISPVARYQVVAWRRALTAAAAAWLLAAGCREPEREPAGEPEAESAQASTRTPVLAPDRLGPLI